MHPPADSLLHEEDPTENSQEGRERAGLAALKHSEASIPLRPPEPPCTPRAVHSHTSQLCHTAHSPWDRAPGPVSDCRCVRPPPAHCAGPLQVLAIQAQVRRLESEQAQLRASMGARGAAMAAAASMGSLQASVGSEEADGGGEDAGQLPRRVRCSEPGSAFRPQATLHEAEGH